MEQGQEWEQTMFQIVEGLKFQAKLADYHGFQALNQNQQLRPSQSPVAGDLFVQLPELALMGGSIRDDLSKIGKDVEQR